MIEILVHLADNPVLGQTAKLTVAGWCLESLLEVATDPATPAEVLEYLTAPENVRTELLPSLLENPSVPARRLVEIAASNSLEHLHLMVASSRVRNLAAVLEAIAANPRLDANARDEITRLLAPIEAEQAEDPDNVLDVDVANYLREHAEEISAAEAVPFQLFGGTDEERAEVAAAEVKAPATSTTVAVSAMAAAAKPERERQNPVQKIAKLSVGERVQLAMKGNKDERFILVRDGARVVCSAVLESPKLTDSEVETFAAMKNVQESVLRGIATKRKFMKNYAVIRILTANPRCPIDVSVPLLGHLLTQDLKHLSSNKNVPETVRKIANKMFRERLTSRSG
jgi:uncharacterized protein (UPF0147 family)